MSFVKTKKQIAAPEVSLLLVNFLPIFGVFFLHWSIFIILFMYWLENIVVGLYSVLKLFRCETKTKDMPKNIAGLAALRKIFMILFFTFHFGMFTLGHGILVFILFYEPGLTIMDIILMFTVLMFSHGISYYTHFLKGEEYRKITLIEIYKAPYYRVFVMHMVVVLGAFLLATLRNEIWLLILLVALKTAFDLKAHNAEHSPAKNTHSVEP